MSTATLRERLRDGKNWCLQAIRGLTQQLTRLIPGPTTLEMPPLTDIFPLYPHPHEAPNEPVTLHEGPVGIPGCDGGIGRLAPRWMPTASLRLEAELGSMKTPDAGDRVAVAVADSTAEVLFSSVNTGTYLSGPFARVSGTVSTFETGTGVGLQTMGFQVVNFNDFLTPGRKSLPVFGYPPQVADLRSGGWRIRLTAVPQSRQPFKSLETNGGYAFTHLGRLEREDGSLSRFRTRKASSMRCAGSALCARRSLRPSCALGGVGRRCGRMARLEFARGRRLEGPRHVVRRASRESSSGALPGLHTMRVGHEPLAGSASCAALVPEEQHARRRHGGGDHPRSRRRSTCSGPSLSSTSAC